MRTHRGTPDLRWASGPGGADRTGARHPVLSRGELLAIEELIQVVDGTIPVALVEAALFGSVARRQARPDSDLDLLLVFEWLPPDREPYATDAESLTARAAERSGFPLAVWSVSLHDLESGQRTPMLVDALTDAIPICYRGAPLPRIGFGPADALRCARALLERVAEGSEEFAFSLAHGDERAAARRARDDIVRLCTGLLLLEGITRPRRADAIEACLDLDLLPLPVRSSAGPLFHWALDSFGPEGRDEQGEVGPLPAAPARVSSLIDQLRSVVRERERKVRGRFDPGNLRPARG